MKFEFIIEDVLISSNLKSIKNALLSIEKEIYSKKLNSEQIIYLLGKIFWKDKKLSKLNMEFGLYLPGTDEFPKRFPATFDVIEKTIEVGIPDDISKWIYANENNYRKFIDVLLISLEHELIHKNQWKKIKKKIVPRIMGKHDNFKSIHEIMAYANSAIRELLMNGKTKEYIYDVIKNFKKYKDEVVKLSPSFDVYYTKFGVSIENKENRIIWQRFLKYIYSYIEKI